MPKELPGNTIEKARTLFAPALKDGEKLKIRIGQSVRLNDSNIGKPEERLEAETFAQIQNAVTSNQSDRVAIPLTEKGNPKVPDIEVVAVSGKGEAGERRLFRQEKNLGISVNEIADLALDNTTVKPEPDIRPNTGTESLTEPQPKAEQNATTEPLTVPPQPKAPLQPSVRNTIKTFTQQIDQLPPSQTKALWRKLSTDFQALGQQFKGVAQKNKEIVNAIQEVPTAIKNDTTTLLNQAKQQIESIKQATQNKVAQTSLDDIASMAIQGTSLAAEAGSKGLGIANQYLQNRADKVKSYGMAKAALRLYNKGHQRTGESTFTANNYAVEAVTDGFKIKDPMNRTIMSFATDKQGKPISVTKEASLQTADYKQINQASKLPVIAGSPTAEAAYAQRLHTIIEGLKSVVAEGDTLIGKNFYINRERDQTISLTTQSFPRRELTATLSNGSQTSTLTIKDMDDIEQSIAASVSIQQTYAAIEPEINDTQKTTQVEMV
ncbi:MAG: hypothetical protein AB8B99_17610 [Phormidesmis sp.]